MRSMTRAGSRPDCLAIWPMGSREKPEIWSSDTARIWALIGSLSALGRIAVLIGVIGLRWGRHNIPPMTLAGHAVVGQFRIYRPCGEQARPLHWKLTRYGRYVIIIVC